MSGRPDSRWALRAWDDGVLTGQYVAQPGTPEAAKAADAVSAVRQPRAELQLYRSPGLNDERLVRDMAYAQTGSRRAVGIRDVLTQYRPRTESQDFSGSPAGFTGSTHDSQGSVFG